MEIQVYILTYKEQQMNNIIKITIAKIKTGEFSIDDEEIKSSPFYEEILEGVNICGQQ